MKSVFFSTAQKEDDTYLKDLMRSHPMPGWIHVAFEREPSYFHAVTTEGKYNQTIVARDTLTNEVIAMGSRSIKPVFINGEVSSLGYLSSLRLLSRYRNAMVLGRGYRYLKQLHRDNRTKAYISTIINDNTKALNTLTSKRCGLPQYHDLGVYYTHIIRFTKKYEMAYRDLAIMRGTKIALSSIVDCLQRNGKKKQFFPYYEQGDFLSNKEYLRDFNIDDFYVATRGRQVVGVLAKWDQLNFKQSVIVGYSGTIKRIRPLYNVFARVVNQPTLPSPGTMLKSFFVSFIAVERNDPLIFSALLNALYNDNIGSEYAYIVVGLYENDPLRRVLRGYHHVKYKSKIFLVYWDDGQEIIDSLDTRIPYLEIASL